MIQRRKTVAKKFLVIHCFTKGTQAERCITQQCHHCMDTTVLTQAKIAKLSLVDRIPWDDFMFSVLLTRTLLCSVRLYFFKWSNSKR